MIVLNEFVMNLITMTLDMTQQNSRHGIFSYKFHMKPNEDVEQIETNGKYTTIARDDIDIDRKYRIAFSVNADGTDETLEFLSDIP